MYLGRDFVRGVGFSKPTTKNAADIIAPKAEKVMQKHCKFYGCPKTVFFIVQVQIDLRHLGL